MPRTNLSEAERELQQATNWRTLEKLAAPAAKPRWSDGQAKPAEPDGSNVQIREQQAAETERRLAEQRAAREAANVVIAAQDAHTAAGAGAAAESVTSMGSPWSVKVSRVERFEGQPRRFFNQDALEALADSIEANGQQQPVKLCRGKAPGVFVLIDGERRWRATHLIWERRKARDGEKAVEPTLDGFIQVIKNVSEHFRASVIANLHREDLSPLDEAAALAQLKTAGDSSASLALMIGKSHTYIDNYVLLHGLSDEVKELMDPSRPKDKRLSVTAAIDIARSTKNQPLRLEIARETLQRELTLTDTRTLIEQRTGKAGYRVGGFKRKPSDDYKTLGSFLGRTRSALASLRILDYARMYSYREDSAGDATYDIRRVSNIMIDLNSLIDDIKANAEDTAFRRYDLLQLEAVYAEFAAMRAKLEKV